jgi:hypothetical protein
MSAVDRRQRLCKAQDVRLRGTKGERTLNCGEAFEGHKRATSDARRAGVHRRSPSLTLFSPSIAGFSDI